MQAVLHQTLREVETDNLKLLNYVDDIWIFSHDKDDRILDNLIKHLGSYNLEVAKEKTLKFETKFEYCGF